MLLGQVFVDGVGHAAEGEGRVLEGEGAGVTCGGPETGKAGVGLGGLQDIGDALDGVEEFGIAGQLGETGELEGEGAEFGNECGFPGLLLGASEIFFPSPARYGHAVGGVEAAVDEIADFEGFFEEFRVFSTADVVGPEETTHVADGGFKDVDSRTLRLAEVDCVKALERFLELFFHPHHPEGV